jgi:hypothetical protein
MRILALLLFSLPLAALDNSVTIYNETGSTQTNHPRRQARWFAQDEICNYPAPAVYGGAILSSWQADVKTRWATSSLCPGGSVQFAIISFPLTINATSNVRIDFRDSADACHLGNLATCQAAALDSAGMLAFNSGNWGAIIQAVADPAGSTTTRTASARLMIEGNYFTYWLRGPVVTEVVAEDATTARSFDFGWRCTATCSWPQSSATWADDTTYRSLHPLFVLTFYSGWSGIRIQYSLANYWTTARQEQRYTLTLKSGPAGATTVQAATAMKGLFATWWRKEAWDGTAPGAARTDYNFPYMVYSRLVFPFKDDVTMSASAFTTFATEWNNNSAGFPFEGSGSMIGNRKSAYGDPGGRHDRGHFAAWQVAWLYSMRSDMYDLVVKNADYAGLTRVHWREMEAAKPYSLGVDGIGLPISNYTRITLRTNAQATVADGLPAAVGPMTYPGPSQWFLADTQHQHTHADLAYFITGDWWYMQEQVFIAHMNLAMAAKSPAGREGYLRKVPWGFLNVVDGGTEYSHRAYGWTLWNVYRGWLAAPDGRVEKVRLKSQLDDVSALLEGYHDVQDGEFYEPCTTSNPFHPGNEQSRWCWARNQVGWGINASTFKMSAIRGGWGSTFSQAKVPQLDMSKVFSVGSPWQDTYVAITLLDMCRTVGYNCGNARYYKDYYRGQYASGVNPQAWYSYYRPIFTRTAGYTTTITAPITASAATIPVADVNVCGAAPFTMIVDSYPYEVIRVLSIGAGVWNTNGSTTSGVGRAVNTSTGFAYSAGQTVYCLRHRENWADLLTLYSSREVAGINYDLGPGDRGPDESQAPTDSHRRSWTLAASALAAQWDSRLGEWVNQHWNTSTMHGTSHTWSCSSDARWCVGPQPLVNNIRIKTTSTTARLLYSAPDGGQCRVYVGTSAPATTDDSADALDTAKGREHTYTATGLSAGTYRYRIGCGKARALGTFTIN